jgi:hypothetical protein
VDANLALALVIALATAVGAGVGGAVTGFINLRNEHKRQRYAREAEHRREAREQAGDETRRRRELKEAARLVDEELRAVTDRLRHAIYQGRFWEPSRELPAGVYNRYSHVLAVNLEHDQDWAEISFAEHELDGANGDARFRPGAEMNALERVELLSVGQAVVSARKALAPLASPPDRESLLTQTADEISAAVFPVPDELDEELRPLLENGEPGGEPD